MRPLFRFPCWRAAWRRSPGLRAALVLALCPSLAAATPICRWTDGQGGTQLSQEVPEAYRHSAVCTDSRQYELPPDQRRAAELDAAQQARERMLRDRARLEEARTISPAPAVPDPLPAVVKRPAEVVTDATDCTTWWRLFDESAECFGAYRTVHGGIKGEAFDVCNVVAGPEPVCGPRRN